MQLSGDYPIWRHVKMECLDNRFAKLEGKNMNIQPVDLLIGDGLFESFPIGKEVTLTIETK